MSSCIDPLTGQLADDACEDCKLTKASQMPEERFETEPSYTQTHIKNDNDKLFNAMAQTNKPTLKPNYRETRKQKRLRLKSLGLL